MPADKAEDVATPYLVYSTRRRLLSPLSALLMVGARTILSSDKIVIARHHHRKGKRKHDRRVPGLVTVRVTFTGSQSVPSDILSVVQFSEIDYNTSPDSFDLTTSQYTVPYSGTYTVNAQAAWKGRSSGQREVLLVKNGAIVVATGNSIPAHESFLTVANVTLKLRRGETLVVKGLQDSGAPVEIFSAVLSLVLVKR